MKLKPISPVMYAVISGKEKMLEALIKHGADINHIDEDGKTPLKVAYSLNKKKIIDILVSAGASEEFDLSSSTLTLCMADVVKNFSIARTTVLRLIGKKKIKAEKIRNRWKILSSDVEEYIKERTYSNNIRKFKQPTKLE